MSEKRSEKRETPTPAETPGVWVKTPEIANEGFVSKLVAQVKCRVLGICERADSRSALGELKGKIEAGRKRETVSVDLSAIAEVRPKISRTGVVRKMLFWTNQDVIAERGVPSSDDDERLLPRCKAQPSETRSALCQKILAKEPDAIRLDGKVKIDFARNLKEMWEEKIATYGAQNPDIRRFYQARVKPYAEGEKKLPPSSRKEYEAEVKRSIERVRKETDLSGGLAKYGIIDGSSESELAKTLIGAIDSNDLIAIGLTEIMDSRDAKFNVRVLETVLASGGWEYFSLIPAMSDRHVSYGPYQHTAMSVWKDGGGATIADDRFTGGKILKTRDIMTLPKEDQHAAAYLLAIHNVAMLVRSMPVERVKVNVPWVAANLPERGKKLAKKKAPAKKGRHEPKGRTIPVNFCETYLALVSKGDKRAMEAFFQFVGAAHNNPKEGMAGLNRWIRKYAASGGIHKDAELKPHIKNSETAGSNAKKQKVNRKMVVAMAE